MACETGFLAKCGFTVIDSSEVNLANAGVGLIVKGEGVSEFGARIGNIDSCNRQVELKLVEAETVKMSFSDSETEDRTAEVGQINRPRWSSTSGRNAAGGEIVIVATGE